MRRYFNILAFVFCFAGMSVVAGGARAQTTVEGNQRSQWALFRGRGFAGGQGAAPATPVMMTIENALNSVTVDSTPGREGDQARTTFYSRFIFLAT
jgi:hypothetical protein